MNSAPHGPIMFRSLSCFLINWSFDCPTHYPMKLNHQSALKHLLWAKRLNCCMNFFCHFPTIMMSEESVKERIVMGFSEREIINMKITKFEMNSRKQGPLKSSGKWSKPLLARRGFDHLKSDLLIICSANHIKWDGQSNDQLIRKHDKLRNMIGPCGALLCHNINDQNETRNMNGRVSLMK